jgi:type II restriction enzyme
LRTHREEIGAEYTIVITPRYVPAVKSDIRGQRVVLLLANTFSEYLYNHIYHDVREIMYSDFDDIIVNHCGEDISKLISNKTIEKFAAHSKKRN